MTTGSALVVEGGAMRGIFACGVLDAFMEQDFHPFDFAIGCSAGACILASHLAGQAGRNLRCFTEHMTQAAFIDAKRFLRGGHWVDFDWLWQVTERDCPLDRARLECNPIKLIVAATAYTTGQPVYLEPKADDLLQVLKSSCALPLLYRAPVVVGTQRLLDGGVAAPIPVQEAYRRGARRIVVIRSRPSEFVKGASLIGTLGAMAFFRSAPFARALMRAHAVYREAVAFMQKPPVDCEVLQIAPPQALATRRTTQRRAALDCDHALGRTLGLRAIEHWEHMERGRARPHAQCVA